jgi:hypothetical protein
MVLSFVFVLLGDGVHGVGQVVHVAAGNTSHRDPPVLIEMVIYRHYWGVSTFFAMIDTSMLLTNLN